MPGSSAHITNTGVKEERPARKYHVNPDAFGTEQSAECNNVRVYGIQERRR